MGWKSMHGDWEAPDEPLRLWHVVVLASYAGVCVWLLWWLA